MLSWYNKIIILYSKIILHCVDLPRVMNKTCTTHYFSEEKNIYNSIAMHYYYYYDYVIINTKITVFSYCLRIDILLKSNTIFYFCYNIIHLNIYIFHFILYYNIVFRNQDLSISIIWPFFSPDKVWVPIVSNNIGILILPFHRHCTYTGIKYRITKI